MTKTCNRCNEIKCLSEFNRRSVIRGGYATECRSCMRIRQRNWVLSIKTEAVSAYGGRCACCEETRLVFLSLDHVNGDGSEHRLQVSGAKGRGGASFYSYLKKQGWPNDPPLQVLCHNCNFASCWGTCPHQEAK